MSCAYTVFHAAGRAVIEKASVHVGPAVRYVSEAGTPERLELRRIFGGSAKSYEFWIDNGLALVGSPDTVIGRIEEQQARTCHGSSSRSCASWRLARIRSNRERLYSKLSMAPRFFDPAWFGGFDNCLWDIAGARHTNCTFCPSAWTGGAWRDNLRFELRVKV